MDQAQLDQLLEGLAGLAALGPLAQAAAAQAAVVQAAGGPAAAAVAVPHQGGHKRLQPFSSAGGTDWITWKSHLRKVVAINGWDDLRARRELAAAMEGEAARMVYDLEVEDDDGNWTLDLVLDAYQGRFLPAAAGRAAMVEFHAAAQRPDETTTQFHARCREMFLRAYPGQNAEVSQQLIQAFSMGLAETDVSRYVLDHGPATYAEASNVAQTKSATEAALALRHKGIGRALHNIGGPQNNAVSGNRTNDKCYHCDKPGHMRRDCFAYKKTLEGGGGRRGGNNRGLTRNNKGQFLRRNNRNGPEGRISQIGETEPNQEQQDQGSEGDQSGNE